MWFSVDVGPVEWGRSCGVAESLMGGVLDHYSPVFVLHAVVNTDTKDTQSADTNAFALQSNGKGAVYNASIDNKGNHCSEFQYSNANGRGDDFMNNSRPVATHANTNTLTGTIALSFASSLFGSSPSKFFGIGGRSYFGTSPPAMPVGGAGHLNAPRKRLGSCKRNILTSLRRDLSIDSQYSSIQATHVAILADTDDWSVRRAIALTHSEMSFK